MISYKDIMKYTNIVLINTFDYEIQNTSLTFYFSPSQETMDY
jgi:hypothetical protein